MVVLGAQSSGCLGAEHEQEARTRGWAGSLGDSQSPVQAGVGQSWKASEDHLKLGM